MAINEPPPEVVETVICRHDGCWCIRAGGNHYSKIRPYKTSAGEVGGFRDTCEAYPVISYLKEKAKGPVKVIVEL